MSIITLTTDFGTRDEYVGVIKGVILRINPGVTLVDISHQIPSQAVAQAGELLASAFAWFPQGSIHLAVVDPEVGSSRAIIAARYAGHIFIAPDNGLLPMIWNDQKPQALVKVQNSRLFLHPVSATFHGRDIFAPVAGHVALGMDLNELGPAIEAADIRQTSPPRAEWVKKQEIAGRIISADHFGNLRTNINRKHLERLVALCENRPLEIDVGGHRVVGLSVTYSQHDNGRLIALINSRNQLEIAVVGASAAQLLKGFESLSVRVYCR
ncbi:MAG: hypothetical protein C4519_20350 [Desulfobacteraceae bacterium]|nr:MAG: hypothetical protein C4519_20350 [Desulfobacteraceae bacterium]